MKKINSIIDDSQKDLQFTVVNISSTVKSDFEIREMVGIVSGLIYIFLMSILIPILIYLDPSFSASPTNFYPLSELSVSEYSKSYYKIILVFGGVCAFLYFELAFIPNRVEYKKLRNWRLIVIFARIGIIGQIFAGIFDLSFTPYHVLAAMLWATGYIFCLVLICLNLEDQLVQNTKYNILIKSGFSVVIIAMLNVFYFRYSSIQGIWQLVIIISVVMWYTFETILYKSTDNDLKSNLTKFTPKSEIKKFTFVILAFGGYLIIFGILLYFNPTILPWRCTNNNLRCDTPNSIILVVGGCLLNLITVKQNYSLTMQKS